MNHCWAVASLVMLTLMLIAPVAMAQTAPDVRDILRSVGETYGNAKQYRFAVAETGEDQGLIQIAVQKPNRFHFETDQQVPGGEDRFGPMTMVSDGNAVWNYASGLQQYTKKSTSLPLADTEPPDVTPETFVLQAETVFITRYVRLATAVDHAKVLRQENFQNAECYVIELQAPLPGFRDTYTWWVDKIRHVVLREDTQPDSPRRRPSRSVFSVARIDEPLPEELFHFTPPPGAKLVGQFE